MSKLRETLDDRKIFFCPGCQTEHAVNVFHPKRPAWSWNGSEDQPTFSPSIRIFVKDRNDPSKPEKTLCHSFVEDGKIRFLSDCEHELAGQTVDLPDWPYAPGQYGGIKE